MMFEEPIKEQKPIRYKYPIPHSATSVLRKVLVEGEKQHPKGDGFKRSPRYHAWCSILHNLWFIINGKTEHIEHAFARGYMALKKYYDWR